MKCKFCKIREEERLELFHRESEVGVWEGFVLQREVPPLAVDALIKKMSRPFFTCF